MIGNFVHDEVLKDGLVNVCKEDINSSYEVGDVESLMLEAIELFEKVLKVFLLHLLESVIQFMDPLLCEVKLCDKASRRIT
ncbi:hypothetical protein QOT17_018831 [Balamuthia mandrillaris]